MAWRNLDPLPVARYRNAAASFRDKFVYTAGGATDFAMTTVPLSILKSRIDAGGEGGNSAWASCAPDFATGKIGCQMQVIGNGYMCVLGGRGATPVATDILTAQDVYIGKIDSDGNIPRWSISSGTLPAPMMDFGVVVKDGYLYLVGGSVLTVTLAYNTQTVNFTAGSATTITGGTSGATALIVSDSDAGATGTLTLTNIVGTFQAGEVITGNPAGSATVTSVAAIVATASASVYRAKIDASGGSLGVFTLLSSVLPAAIAKPRAFVAGGRLFVQDLTNLYSARMQSQGLIEQFTTQVLPFSATANGMAFAQNDDILVIGGFDASAITAATWVTTVNRDGVTKTWSQTAPMLLGKQDFGTAMIADRLFCIGGLITGNTVQTEVQAVRVEPSGRISGAR